MTEPVAAGGVWPVRQLRLFFIALQFFTRLPVPGWVGFREEWLQPSARFFPLTGVLVGGATALVAWAAGWVLPAPLAVLLSLAASIWLTGALHEDGFSDVCDGFGGGREPAHVLEIMKDSRIGVYGAVGIGLLLAIKCVALVALPRGLLPVALLAAHPLSRALAATLMWRMKYVRAGGKSAAMARGMRTGEFLFAAISGLVPCAALMAGGLLAWQQALAGVVIAVLCTLYLIRLFLRRIGGYTGDCLGAAQQLTDTGFYLGMVGYAFSIHPSL